MKKLHARPATPDDLGPLVDFVQMAGEGLPELAWSELAEEGETLRDVGLRRAARDSGGFSWRNATLFEKDGEVLGGLMGFRLPDEPEEIGPDFPAEFVPLQELENLAPGSWYVNILGVYGKARGTGIGTEMLDHAGTLAQETGAAGLSIIVFSANPGAERLYRRVGYEEVARRKMNVPAWRHDGCDAILLVKPLA